MNFDQKVAFISAIFALLSLLVALAGVFVALLAISRANKTTSGSTFVALNEAIRQAWERFFQAKDMDAQIAEIGEVLNLLEVACALHVERSLDGASRELMHDYLKNILPKLVENHNAHVLIEPLMQSETTFIYIKKFLKIEAESLSVTVPPKWYQLPAR